MNSPGVGGSGGCLVGGGGGGDCKTCSQKQKESVIIGGGLDDFRDSGDIERDYLRVEGGEKCELCAHVHPHSTVKSARTAARGGGLP